MRFASDQLRHVVFPDTRRGLSRALNFTPRRAPSLPRWYFDDIHGEENALVIWIFNQCGLNARMYRPESLRRRVSALLRTLGVTSAAQAKSAIQRDVRLLRPALSALVIGVTRFFRDGPVFDLIHREILPLLCERHRGTRAWSVGCSDGAELYSLAILLAEHNRLDSCELLGTDCRPDAIHAAATGRYDPPALAGVPDPLRDRYFTSEEDCWTIQGWLRMVPRWRVENALRISDTAGWDMILCRNFAMYLKVEAAVNLWQRLELALRPGGYLIVGRAERPSGATRLSFVAPGIFQRNKG
jgi:chemotaxis methyl-accepting protein methylase